MIKPVLHYYQLDEAVMAFTTTRHGGMSKGNFGELNINPFRGDTPEAVEANRQAVAQTLQLPADRVIRQHQVHGVECRQVTEDFFSLPASGRQQLLEGVDAVITNIPQTCVGVFTADCVPILLFDPVQKAVGAVHAGWRGTLQRILAKTVVAMQETYGSRPSDLKALIGPCISKKNFEVGQEVYDLFAEADFDMERIAILYDKWHIDLPLTNQLELEAVSVKSENILQSGICTFDNSDDYFSARKLKENFGTIYTGIILK